MGRIVGRNIFSEQMNPGKNIVSSVWNSTSTVAYFNICRSALAPAYGFIREGLIFSNINNIKLTIHSRIKKEIYNESR